MKFPAFASLPSFPESVGRFTGEDKQKRALFSSLSARLRVSHRMLSSNMDLSLIEGSQMPSTGVYDAVLPPAETLVGMGVVIVLCIACAWYWNEKVVPVSRTNLAISKSRGEVKQYLDELRSSDPALVKSKNSIPSPSVFDDDLTIENENANYARTVAQTQTSDRALERWLFTDWLVNNKSERKSGMQKEPALPILRDAKWNSGDNPVVVTAALMVLGLTLTAFTERLSASL
ncbi:hypothetical protein IV203_002079 [Nitzschia inconspicua]|uniref:Uncharacterized protein n=1 Tax=Nitzschia inconspicua TaxID=303405 RepID=A0A9K3LAP3_9STRA|nr:hypothetical protein IV203_002079 [Nitzschia inconspicua]